jgi:hypothetical protein
MPIDLDDLVIIDLLLDAVIELCLLPDTWTEQELKILCRLHSSTLHLNRLWTEDCFSMREFLHHVKTPLFRVHNYIDLLEITLNNEQKECVIPKLEKLCRYADLIMQKTNFLSYQLRYSSSV